MKNKFYNFFRKLDCFFIKVFYRIEYIDTDNIPTDEGILFVGNHKNNLDALALIGATKREIHFVTKRELTDGKFGWFFRKLGVIPVDRNNKGGNKEAIDKAIELLKNDSVVAIFPEGTFNKTEYVIMPFKMGAVKMAKESDASIVPFAIVNDYKLFRKSVKVIFGKSYKVNDKLDLKKENITLMNKVIKLLKNENI